MANLSAEAAFSTVLRNLRETKQRFQLAMQQYRGDQLAARTLARLKTEPGRPNYPIRFKTDRQRAAFFATRGFGRGIPAGRNNPPDVLEAWEAEFIATADGGILAITNDEPHMKFVQGEYAQPFHLDTGYVQVDDVIIDAFREMESVAVQEFYAECDPLEGL